MKLEGGKITYSQLLFLVIGFVWGSSVIISPGRLAGKEAWLATLAGFAVSLIFVVIFTSLVARFPGKTIVEINDTIFGPLLGKIISLSYLSFFLHLASLVLRNFGDFLVQNVLFNTPMLIILSLKILVAASAVRNGIEVIARCSLLLVITTIFAFALNNILIINQMDLSNLLPIMDISLASFLKASHLAATFPFGESVIFIMIIAFSDTDPQKVQKSVIAGLALAALVLVISSIRDITVLGEIIDISAYPSYSTLRLVNIGDVITRVEIIIAAVFFFTGFIKFSLLYYGSTLGLAQIFKLRSYLPLVYPLGIIITVLAVTQFENAIENINFASLVYPYYSLLFELILPLLTLLIAVIKGLPKTSG